VAHHTWLCLFGGVGGLEGGSDALTESPFSILN